MGDVLRVSLIQTDVVWEDKRANLDKYAAILSHITGDCDLVVFPEMFTTGFSMRAEDLAECIDGETITEVKKWSRNYNVAIAGSFIARAGNVCFNRGFFIEPDGSEHYYDKRHLFRMGEEGRHFVSGSEKLVVNYRGWNICLLVCYDLRFPVWCRNVGNEYDLLLFVANWPQSRSYAWRNLLIARAIENAAYVCGVNRIGQDETSMVYRGDTMAIGVKGEVIAESEPFVPQIVNVELNLSKLKSFRETFPVWKDADEFVLKK